MTKIKQTGVLPVLILVILLLLSAAVQAQDDVCLNLVQRALEVTDAACETTGRNQVCYGNIQLTAEAREGFDLVFTQPGDVADVLNIQSLVLSSMDTKNQEWGVALMRIQANLPDSLPGQNVTLLLFGDVEIENAEEPPAAADSTDEETFSPMQAFYLRSGIGDAPCEGAPDSGILIQTPEGAGEINLNINAVDITLGSTAYFQAVAGDALDVDVIEGMATVTAQGVTQTVPAGAGVEVPIDDNLQASGPPDPPQPYDEATLQALPVAQLEREITVAPALTETDLASLALGISGTFNTSYGMMTFEDGYAPYTGDNGRLLYEVDGHVMRGYWVEADSAKACDSQRDGSSYWGRIEFTFNATFTAFTGLWSYCEDELSGGWDGTRVE